MRDVPFVPAQLQGLALGGGVLSYAVHSDAAQLPSLYDHDVSFAGAPAVGERRLRHTQPSNFHGGVHALGDSRTGFTSSVGMYVPNADKSLSVVRLPVARKWCRPRAATRSSAPVRGRGGSTSATSA
ncbi:hypothetical protein [Streptomyces sp. NPDC048057]|uniref:hypothetical protein n=1 Tax=Streptomyces sp. NPDC048057 TaxID=3155628 RepID=UPI0033E9CA7F